MRAYTIRDVDWWGPVEVNPHYRTWAPWRGLDAPAPPASRVRVSHVPPTGDVGKHVMATGQYAGKPLLAVPIKYLRTYGRRKPMTRGAARDRHAVRILLASLPR